MTLDRERLMRQYAPRLIRSADEDTVGSQPSQDVEDVSQPEHTGVMVAFFVDPVTAQALALSDGGDGDEEEGQGRGEAEDPDELHVTLAYLGTLGVDVTAEQVSALNGAVTAWAAQREPMTGVISGIGVFNNSDGPVTYASVDIPGLPQARQELIETIAAAGLEVASNHGFTPHITLAYADRREVDVPRLPIVFSVVTVAAAGQRLDVPLARTEATSTQPALTFHTLPRPRPGVDGQAAKAASNTHIWKPVLTTTTNRMYVTAPASVEVSSWNGVPSSNPLMLWMQGRFVGADEPNRNRAFWASADLEMGEPTVVHGPLNWLHEDKHVIGTIADAKLVPAGQDIPQAHIAALSAIWRWVYPHEAAVVTMAAELGQLAYSMECISESVQCVGDNGCGESFPYDEFAVGKCCRHLKERSSIRRLVNPTFLGGAVIVPPSKPGWAEANATVMRQAAAMAEDAYEQAGRPDIPATVWEQLMAGVVSYSQN